MMTCDCPCHRGKSRCTQCCNWGEERLAAALAEQEKRHADGNTQPQEALTKLVARMRERGEVFGAGYGCYRAPADPEIMAWADTLEASLAALTKELDALKAERDEWRSSFGLQTSNGWQTAAEAKALWDRTWKAAARSAPPVLSSADPEQENKNDAENQ